MFVDRAAACVTTLTGGTPSANRETVTYVIDRAEALPDEGIRDKVYPGAVWAVGDSVGILQRHRSSRLRRGLG